MLLSYLENVFIITHIYEYIFIHTNNIYPLKVATNINSIIHAVGTSLFCSVYLFFPNYNIYYWIIIYSSSYFIHDILLIIRYKSIIANITYLLHHIISIYTLYTCNYDVLIKGLLIMELSNVPNTIVYHAIKQNYSINTINHYKIYQKYIYSFLRVFCSPFLVYSYYNIFTFYEVINLCILYSLGSMWSCKLWINT